MEVAKYPKSNLKPHPKVAKNSVEAYLSPSISDAACLFICLNTHEAAKHDTHIQ